MVGTMRGAKILVSACLLGRPVRFDGATRTIDDNQLRQWQAQGRLVAICPEMIAGMGVPRPAAEIARNATGENVLSGIAKVVTGTGDDVTACFIAGAQAALALAVVEGCRFALLTDGSPSCGSGFVYDGSFTGSRSRGMGVTTALLQANGIVVFSETQIDALAQAIEAG